MDLTKKTLPELREIAKAKGIKRTTGIRKQELVLKIAEAMKQEKKKTGKRLPADGVRRERQEGPEGRKRRNGLRSRSAPTEERDRSGLRSRSAQTGERDWSGLRSRSAQTG